MSRVFKPKQDTGVRIRRPGRLREFLEDTAQAAALADHGLYEPALSTAAPGAESKKIVAVSTEAVFSEALIRQTLGVAERLGTEVVGLSVCPGGAEATGGHAAKARELHVLKAEQSAASFARQAGELGVAFRHVVRFGRAADVVEQECARLRRVEFVLAVKEQRGRDGFHVSMPLFEVIG